MTTPRRIAVVTSSRADYTHLHWPLRAMQAQPEIAIDLIVTGAHLSPEFGMTVREIERDGHPINRRIECLLSSDTDVGMAKTIGLATLSFADAFAAERPDLLLLIADRYEMLAPASAALAMRIPIAHIEGGELSEGAIDQQVRNALTMLSHIHLTTTEQAAARLVGMGEEPWRVHRVGAASLDHLRCAELLSREETASRLDMDLTPPVIVIGVHPLTIERETTIELDAIFAALRELRGRPGLSDLPGAIVFCFPNADAGSRRIMERAQAFCEMRDALSAHSGGRGGGARLFVNLDRVTYWSLLRCADVMVGNSSSGIMESPSLSLPAVNVGRRQQGRERAANVIDAPAERGAIVEAVRRALDPAFRRSLGTVENPYGDGHAAERIARILAEAPLTARLLEKRGSEALPPPDHPMRRPSPRPAEPCETAG